MTLILVLGALAVLLAYVALRSGPLAPVAATEATVAARPIRPALFGIGTIEARRVYKIGPTQAGRVAQIAVDVGDRVFAGQLVAEMAQVDLPDRLAAQAATVRRAEAALQEAKTRREFASVEARRYERLFAAHTTSEEKLATRRQELRRAEAGLAQVQAELVQARANLRALSAQADNLRLLAPADGIVTGRAADPGMAVGAGQSVIEIVDPASLWVNVRVDQVAAGGLRADLPARIVLRSRRDQAFAGKVLRVEPRADPVTEELLAKVVFDTPPAQLPPLGELAEVTIELPGLPAAPVVPNAALRQHDGATGVWRLVDGAPHFVAVTPGASDLEGNVQLLDGVGAGDRVVVYSERALGPQSRIHIVDALPGGRP
ncbi:efflux RND transporter periplasmic adaptor subunit [Acidimangrovimonas pyrenivorans]|uniref:Efflux RND transporter periplasmic adaptor subunit n=1 Tax=Acidimangrovimonas pyrenivorans TaxID=2030798 RepID=A0ABV7AFK8_9RHOB